MSVSNPVDFSSLHPEWLDRPESERFGVMLEFRCPHRGNPCGIRIRIYVANPLDGKASVAPAGTPAWRVSGANFSTLTLSNPGGMPSIDVKGHFHAHIRDGVLSYG